jgi:hypothetical protein
MLEAVSAAVKALGEGKIQLAPLEPRTRLDFVRYAPASSPGICAPPDGADNRKQILTVFLLDVPTLGSVIPLPLQRAPQARKLRDPL